MISEIGFISDDNARYLCNEGVLNVNGSISGRKITIGEHDLHRFSMFCEIRSDIENSVDDKLNVDQVVTLMRTGNLDINYKHDGRDLVKKVAYKMAVSQTSSGFMATYFRVREDAASRGRGKKSNFNFN